MENYLLIFRGGRQNPNQTQEELEAHMTKWGAWMNKLIENNQFVGGDPLENESNMLYKNNNGSIATDGPYPEGKELVGGYVMIKADNREKAIEIAKGCPIFEDEGTLELRKTASMEDHHK